MQVSLRSMNFNPKFYPPTPTHPTPPQTLQRTMSSQVEHFRPKSCSTHFAFSQLFKYKRMARMVSRHIKLSKPRIIFLFPDGRFLKKKNNFMVYFLGDIRNKMEFLVHFNINFEDRSSTLSSYFPKMCNYENDNKY